MLNNFLEPTEINTLKKLEEEVSKVLLIADKGLVKIVIATVIANRMNSSPVWLLLVAPPSGGKTEFISAISSLPFVYAISDLTVNTFASGQKRADKETSLLLRMNNGIMAFKDFTSLLSKDREAKNVIMGQLREIYDGEYVKRTGTGDDITWRGKMGAIAGCTEIIYRHLEDMSAMGDRFIMYNILQPDSFNASKRALRNTNKVVINSNHLKECFTHYINSMIENMEESTEIILDDETSDEILKVADFAVKARSAVMTDFKTGAVDFVPTPEMPMRMARQLYTLACAFISMNKADPDMKHNEHVRNGQITPEEKKLLFKIAFDSISKSRRDILIPLAKYREGVTTAGVATFLNLPSMSAAKYLQQVNALKLCTRIKKAGAQGDTWKMPDNYRNVICKLESIEVVSGMLAGEDIDNDYLGEEVLDPVDDFASFQEQDKDVDLNISI